MRAPLAGRSGSVRTRPRSSSTASLASIPRLRAATDTVAAPGGTRTPARRCRAPVVSRRTIVSLESGEKSERQNICLSAPGPTPSTVGESTAEPRPGVVAPTRKTG